MPGIGKIHGMYDDRSRPDITIIGGGLAGSEAAWQAAERGLHVRLCEMRPIASTGAHTSSYLAELVCSNSLGSNLSDRAPGLLKDELRQMGSLLLRIAEKSAVPAGGALAVDRDAFARGVTWPVIWGPSKSGGSHSAGISRVESTSCDQARVPRSINTVPLPSALSMPQEPVNW